MNKIKDFYKKHSFSIDFVLNIIASFGVFFIGYYFICKASEIETCVDKYKAYECGFALCLGLYFAYKSGCFFVETLIDLYKYKKLRKERALNDCINVDFCNFSNCSNGGISDSNDCNKE